MNLWILFYNKQNRGTPDAPSAWTDDGMQRARVGRTTLFFRVNDRYTEDQIFSASDTELLVQDGVVVNLDALRAETGCTALRDVLFSLGADAYPARLTGPNCGAYYTTQTDLLRCHTNHTGDGFLFYADMPEYTAVSNDLNLIHAWLKHTGQPVTPDERALMALMTYGFMIDDRTPVSEICRLGPGKRLLVTPEGARTEVYCRFEFADREMTKDEALEKMDALFRASVERSFRKDLAYGITNHLTDMSGGLDSRMTNVVARDLGFDGIVDMNYCQSGSVELRCSSAVAAHLGNRFLYMQLDDHSFLYDIDKLIDMNYGLAIFCGITGGEQMLSALNTAAFGLEHTGMLGGAVADCYCNADQHMPVSQTDYRYSQTVDFPIPEDVLRAYENNEAFGFYCRGFRGVLSTGLIRRHYAYPVSPFVDPELLAFCFSIPLRYRNEHRLYLRWIEKKYPDVASLPSTRPPYSKPLSMLFWRARRKSGVLRYALLKKLGRADLSRPRDMNPFSYWWDTDEKLRAFCDAYYQDNMPRLEMCPSIRDDVETLYASSLVMDKMLALNVLGVFKRYFS